VVCHAPWRADHDVDSLLERISLRAKRAPPTKGQHPRIGAGLRQLPKRSGHLFHKLSSRAEHQRSGRAWSLSGWDSVQEAQAKGRGLAASGLGQAAHIPTGQDGRQSRRLDGRHLREAHPLSGQEQIGRKANGVERDGKWGGATHAMAYRDRTHTAVQHAARTIDNGSSIAPRPTISA
tara:strand:- start:290 stop:823 length:534 start_codon:yes stop_codon:yes gene_type:complete